MIYYVKKSCMNWRFREKQLTIENESFLKNLKELNNIEIKYFDKGVVKVSYPEKYGTTYIELIPLQNFKYKELKNICYNFGLSRNKNKQQLIKSLKEIM